MGTALRIVMVAAVGSLALVAAQAPCGVQPRQIRVGRRMSGRISEDDCQFRIGGIERRADQYEFSD